MECRVKYGPDVPELIALAYCSIENSPFCLAWYSVKTEESLQIILLCSYCPSKTHRKGLPEIGWASLSCCSAFFKHSTLVIRLSRHKQAPDASQETRGNLIYRRLIHHKAVS